MNWFDDTLSFLVVKGAVRVRGVSSLDIRLQNVLIGIFKLLTYPVKSLVTSALYLVLVGAMLSACNNHSVEPFETRVPTDIKPDIKMEEFSPPDPERGLGDVHEALINRHRFQIEVARTSLERARGLKQRPSLPEDQAMLFIYKREGYLTFWMKETLIPLDILFLAADGVVVDIQTMHTQPDALEGELKLYHPARPARYAIEINAGLAKALGIVPGTQALFR